MLDDKASIIRKVQLMLSKQLDLLRLADITDNEAAKQTYLNEASNAALLIAKLAKQYDIDKSKISTPQTKDNDVILAKCFDCVYQGLSVHSNEQPVNWHIQLAKIIAKYLDCEVMTVKDSCNFYFIGYELDVIVSMVTMAYIGSAIEKAILQLIELELKKPYRGRNLQHKINAAYEAAIEPFIAGALISLSQKFELDKVSITNDNPLAIVIFNNKKDNVNAAVQNIINSDKVNKDNAKGLSTGNEGKLFQRGLDFGNSLPTNVVRIIGRK